MNKVNKELLEFLPTVLAPFGSVSGFFELGSPSLKYPGMIKAQELAIEIPFRFLDIIIQGYGGIPAIVVSAVVIDEFPVDRRYRQRVVTAEEMIKFPVKVIVDYGLRAGSPPSEFAVYSWIDGWMKKIKFLKVPTGSNFFRIFIPGVVGRLFTVAKLVMRVTQMAGFIFCIYSYLKNQDYERNFSATSQMLSNKNKRKKERVRIYRRVGGVRP